MNIDEEKNFLSNQLKEGINKLNQNLSDDALTYFTKILSIRPNHSQTINLQGICYYNLKKYSLAIQNFELAISIDPDQDGFFINLGNTYKEINEFEKAKETYEEGLKLKKNQTIFYNQLGLLFFSTQNYERAKEFFFLSLKYDSNNYQALNNLGQVENELSNFEKAKEYYNKSIEKNNNYSVAHFNLGLSLIREGNFELGWKNYEYRDNKRRNLDLTSDKIEWTGSNLEDNVLLIICEQGIGDNIQFIRYVSQINKKNSKIYLLIKHNLVSLFTKIENVDKIFTHKDQIPRFDYYVYLLSLPNLFNTIKPFPKALNFFSFNQNKINNWNNFFKKYNSKLNIGLCWQGDSVNNKNDYKRSIPLKLFQSIFDIDNINIFSLQKNNGTDQINNITITKNNFVIFDQNYDEKPFEDTLCIIKHLDLIITIDTSIAHISGTLEKNTWLLLSKVCDFRWGIKTEKSLWYDSVKLYRQTDINNWEEVINRVKEDLIKMIK